jgi:hypothetical protein
MTTTPADQALHAADRLARAAEDLTDYHRRNPFERGGHLPIMSQDTIRRLMADLECCTREYRRRAQRVPKTVPA